MSEIVYSGTELELFTAATNWKAYIKFLVQQYIQGHVLEVGAGIGKNTGLLCRPRHHTWLCLEPDSKLFQALNRSIHSYGLTSTCQLQQGTISTLKSDLLFDSILYLDVLEHICEDKEEVVKAAHHLRVGGHLIILAPAHQWLFTPFDEEIGHCCRYSKSKLRNNLPNSIKIVRLIYLDCIGLFAILGNKFILKQSQPTMQQIRIWDKFMVPISQRLDALLGNRFGKSVLLIGEKIECDV